MSLLSIIGIAMTGLGLAGLAYCIREARRIRGPEVSDNDRRTRLARLVAVNMGAVAVAFLGLGLVVMGFLI
ncbi:MAG: hypothetical protein AAGE18_18905 [Pseudomonadota bacterium]